MKNFLPPEFPCDTLGEFSGFLREVSQCHSVNPEMVALPMLSTLAAAMGGKRWFRAKKGYLVPPVIWTAVIAPSGDNKSGPFNAATAPLWVANSDAMEEWEEEMARYAVRMKLYKREFAQWTKQRSKEDPPEEPPKPICDRFLTTDCTIEGLSQTLRQNPSLLNKQEELSNFLNFDKYASSQAKGGAAAAPWLEMFDGRGFSQDRVGRGPVSAKMACVSVTGTIQPQIFHRMMTDSLRENGLASRLLLAQPPSLLQYPNDYEYSRSTESWYQGVVDTLLGLRWGENRKPIYVTASPAAKKLLRACSSDLERMKHEHDDNVALRSSMGKLRGYAHRLALVIEFANWAAGEDEEPAEISECSAAAADSLCRWFADEAVRVYEQQSESESERWERKVNEYLYRHPGPQDLRSIMRNGPTFLRESIDECERILRSMPRTVYVTSRTASNGQAVPVAGLISRNECDTSRNSSGNNGKVSQLYSGG